MFSCKVMIFMVLAFNVGVLGQVDELNSSSVNYVCLDCVKLVGAVLNFMKDKPIQDDVVNMIDNEVCGRLNYVFMKDCTDQVEGFVPYFMEYMQSKISRVAVCQGFNLCPYVPYDATTPIPAPSHQFIQDTIKATMLKNRMGAAPVIPSAECTYCELAEGEISMLLENQQAKSIVKEYLGEICNELPFNSVQCANLLALYVDQVFHITLQYLQDNEACVEIELCPKAVADIDTNSVTPKQITETTTMLENKVSAAPVVPSAECTYCELAEGEISMLLENQQAKSIVKEYLGEICNELPFNSVQCANLLALYVDQVFHITLQYMQDNEVCIELELCPKAIADSDSRVAASKKVIEEIFGAITSKNRLGSGPVVPSAECRFCELAEGEISMLLENQQAKSIVKEYLGEICNELPFNSVQCANLLALYVDQVFHITLQYMQNNEVCVELELCPKAVADAHSVLGAESLME